MVVRWVLEVGEDNKHRLRHEAEMVVPHRRSSMGSALLPRNLFYISFVHSH